MDLRAEWKSFGNRDHHRTPFGMGMGILSFYYVKKNKKFCYKIAKLTLTDQSPRGGHDPLRIFPSLSPDRRKIIGKVTH